MNMINTRNLALNGVMITSTIHSVERAVAAIGFQFAIISAPIQTPANSETRVCLVAIAKIMATRGGASARMPYSDMVSLWGGFLNSNKSRGRIRGDTPTNGSFDNDFTAICYSDLACYLSYLAVSSPKGVTHVRNRLNTDVS